MNKILLAEGDVFLIGVYANQLRKMGYSISIAPDGEIAINRIKSINPDLLIIDAALPKIDAMGVLKALRQDMGFNELKVIMLSNFAQGADAEKIKEFGVLKYFIKAENTAEEIADEIKRILS